MEKGLRRRGLGLVPMVDERGLEDGVEVEVEVEMNLSVLDLLEAGCGCSCGHFWALPGVFGTTDSAVEFCSEVCL